MGAAEDHDQARRFPSSAKMAGRCLPARLAVFRQRMHLAGGPESRLLGLQIREEAGHAGEFIKEQTHFEQAYFNEAIFEQAY
jgi:hypothetical protein